MDIDKFLKYVNYDNDVKYNSIEEFLKNTSGKSFLNGLYTIFKKEDIEKWNGIIGEYFPDYKGSFSVFAYDWMGRIFVIENNSNMVKMFDPEERTCYATDMDIVKFHEEIVNDTDSMLSLNYFNQRLEKNNNKIIKYGECVGFKTPLFLGGKDELDNLEEIDMDVYWTITLDINNAVKGE